MSARGSRAKFTTRWRKVSLRSRCRFETAIEDVGRDPNRVRDHLEKALADRTREPRRSAAIRHESSGRRSRRQAARSGAGIARAANSHRTPAIRVTFEPRGSCALALPVERSSTGSRSRRSRMSGSMQSDERSCGAGVHGTKHHADDRGRWRRLRRSTHSGGAPRHRGHARTRADRERSADDHIASRQRNEDRGEAVTRVAIVDDHPVVREGLVQRSNGNSRSRESSHRRKKRSVV